jgi:hypothetical protein
MHADVLTLLREARAAGLTIRLHGDKVDITGPRSVATRFAGRMKAAKAEIVAVLRGDPVVAVTSSRIVRTCRFCTTLPGVFRPTVQGKRLFCEICGKRKGCDMPYPWGPQ